jgi:hypothetical protein
MKNLNLHIITLAAAAALAGCGGGSDTAQDAASTTPATPTTPTTPTTPPGDTSGGTTASTLTCDTALFSIAATVPTSAQLTAYAKTYAGSVGNYSSTTFAFTKTGDATLVFKADGTATYKGAALDLKSVCYIDDPRSRSIVLHWGTRGTAGAAAFYDNHVDLFADGTASGAVGADVFKAP